MSYADFASGEPREYPDPLDPHKAEPAAVDRTEYYATISVVRRVPEPMVPGGFIERREASVSPAFATLVLLDGWLVEAGLDATAASTVARIRRRITANGVSDEVVMVDDVVTVDGDRLHAVVVEVRDRLVGAVGHRLPRPGDRAAPASTAVVEGEGAREQVMGRAEATRQQRLNERPLRGGDPDAPMLAYKDVYDAKGDPRPEYAADVERWRAAGRAAR